MPMSQLINSSIKYMDLKSCNLSFANLMSIMIKTRNSAGVNKIWYDMEYCKFVNSVKPGRFRKKSDHPEWSFPSEI